jgi:hypothetical protein
MQQNNIMQTELMYTNIVATISVSIFYHRLYLAIHSTDMCRMEQTTM